MYLYLYIDLYDSHDRDYHRRTTSHGSSFLSPPQNKDFYIGMSFYQNKSIDPIAHKSL